MTTEEAEDEARRLVMPPTLKNFEKGILLSACLSVCLSVCASVNF